METQFALSVVQRQGWRETVDVAVCVDYLRGPAEYLRWTIGPSAHWRCARVIRLIDAQQSVVQWTDLPGTTLSDRCFGVIAVQMFGTFDMAARIVGAPIWRKVSALVSVQGEHGCGCEIEVLPVMIDQVLLRHRPNHASWTQQSDGLTARDADPLHALLRRAMRLGPLSSEPTTSSASTVIEDWRLPAFMGQSSTGHVHAARTR